MVFVGSRIRLGFVSSGYKDVWITFIREFNRFARKKSYSKEELIEKVEIIQEKVKILEAEVLKKIDTFGRTKKYSEAKHNFTALSTSLGQLHVDFDGIKTFSDKDIIKRK